MKLILLSGLITTSVVALALVIRGDWFINLLPVVQKFRTAHEVWGNLHIDDAAIRSCSSLDRLGQRRFEEVSHSDNDPLVLNQVRDKRLGDIVTVVSYKERHLRQLTRELRNYSAVFLILLANGALINADQFVGKTFKEIVDVVLSYHVVPLLEMTMLVYLLIRLIAETQSITSLLEGE